MVGGDIKIEYDGTFVGREKNLARFREFLSGGKEDEPTMLLLSGERGIGKTSLLKNMKVEIEEAGFVYLRGECYDTNSDPYLPLREAFEQYEEKPNISEEDESVFLSTHILSRSVEDEGSEIFSAEKKTIFYETMNRIKDMAEENPLLISLDDLQWSDELTLKMLHYLSLKLKDEDILFAGAYDDNEVQNNPEFKNFLFNMRQEGLVETMELEPLGLKETQRVIEDLTSTEDPSKKFVNFIHMKSDGNPLFIKEMVCHLEEQNELSVHTFSGVDRKEFSLPTYLLDIIEHRFDDLTGRSRQVMKAGSVIGEKVDLDILAIVVSLEESEMLDEIDILLDKNLLKEEEETLRFAHPLFKEVIYSSINKLRKKKLHEKTAEAIKEAKAHETSKYYLDIALHYEKAGIVSSAFSNYEKAGNDAERIGALHVALDCYEKALKLGGKCEELKEGRKRVRTTRDKVKKLIDQKSPSRDLIKS